MTLGPCFTTPKTDPATCKHTTAQQFSWHARDDTAPHGEALIVVCMGCDTVLRVGQEGTKGKRPKTKDQGWTQ